MLLLRRHKSVFWLLCVLVVTLRLTGVQEHLCLDGGGPPVTLHFGADALLQHPGDSLADARAPHSDTDISVAANLVAKRCDGSAAMPVLLATAALVLGVLPAPSGSAIGPEDPLGLPGTLDSYFQPPLRAPPAPTSLTV